MTTPANLSSTKTPSSKMTQNNLINLSSWFLAEPTSNSKGQKTCQLTSDHGPVIFHLGSHLKTRFGASSFDKSIDTARKNLDFDITLDANLIELLKLIDEWTIDYIYSNQSRLCKAIMSREAVAANYKPLLTTYGSSTSVRTKINIRGSRTCLCWDANYLKTQLPEEGQWLNNIYDVQVSLPQLYMMNNNFGWTMECQALRVTPIEHTCPFK